MNAPPTRGQTPRQMIEEECLRRGKHAVVIGCIALLKGEETDAELIVALGGPPAYWAISGERGGPPYWLRVWAVRALLRNWEDEALPAVVAALGDDEWRVREMAVKVVTRHQLGETLTVVADLQHDPNRRVRTAASRALVRLIETDA